MSRFIQKISQSVSALAVLGIMSTSVAVASPTTTVPDTTTTTATTVAASSTTSSTSNGPDLNGTAINPDDLAQGGPLSDVPEGHWAYDAVAQLVKDGLIKGYPDGQFKGNRPMTRYEAAVLTYRAVDQIEAQITAGKAVAQADIDAVKKLLAAFGNELKAVESHVDTLQKQVDEIKHEADATQLRVNQGKVGFQLIERPGTAYTNVSVYNGGPTTQFGATPGNMVPKGQGLSLTNALGTSFSFGPGALNSSVVGPQIHGVNYALARFVIGGQVDARWSYGLRVSDKLVEETPLGATSISPSFCTVTTTTNCSFTALNNGGNTQPLNLDYGYLGYSSPGGITAQIGRYSNGSYGRFAVTPESQIYAGGQETGFNVGYNDPHGRFFAQAYVGYPSVDAYTLQASGNSTTQNVCSQNVVGLNYASNSVLPGAQVNYSGINPNCNTTQREIGGWFAYYLPGPRVVIGGTTDNFVGKQFTYYNPSAVNCTVKGTALSAVSPQACVANGGTYAAGAAQGNYLTALGNPQLIEAFLAAYMGPKSRPDFRIGMTWDRNITQNPFTGGAYGSANAYDASLTYASKGNLYSTGSNDNPFISAGGRRNSNVFQFAYQYYGLNSVGGIQTGVFTGATPPTSNAGFSNPNGMYLYGAQIGHWFSDSVRFSISGFHIQNNANIPVGTNGTTNTCAGCFVNYLSENQLNAEMYLYFF